LALLPVETAQSDLFEPSSEKWLLNGLSRLDETAVLDDVIARAISVTEAGSCSGGECCQRSRGFMAAIDRLGMSTGLLKLRTPGDVERGSTALFRRRALASQFVIWVLFSPV
jgi:hypothetical protein